MKRIETGRCMKKLSLAVISLALSLMFIISSFSMEMERDKKAIVIAFFGTSYPSALGAVTNIKDVVQKTFPNIKIKLAFTSNIIRKIWHKRQNDHAFLNTYQTIPKDILNIKGLLATIADLQDEGYHTIIVQPTHVYYGEEYADMTSYVNGLNSIKTIKAKYMPFKKLVVGRPLLGGIGPGYDYHEDMITAAKVMIFDVELAQKEHAALVYMGHGNAFYSTGVYIEFQEVMRKIYPETSIFVGTVEGYPSLDNVLFGLAHMQIKKVLLKPFMIVAGDHAKNDMAGKEDDSWKSVMESKGIHVIDVLQGLGENPDIAKIFVNHIKDVARDNNIEL